MKKINTFLSASNCKSVNMHKKSGCLLIDKNWSMIERSLSIPNLFELGISCNVEENSLVTKELQALVYAKSESVNSPYLSSPAHESLDVRGDQSAVAVKLTLPLELLRLVSIDLADATTKLV